jgi:hypothetical protein
VTGVECEYLWSMSSQNVNSKLTHSYKRKLNEFLERSVKCERVVLTRIEERKGFVKVENLRHYAKFNQAQSRFERPTGQLTQCHRDKYQEKIGEPVFKLRSWYVRHSSTFAGA